ncbi:ABC transporter permease [bacterium (candidate division B38) B3_B38]|nr:MAG: ABC transporter permease [bacterium (candidate division B38) B3_B38]
MKDFLRLIRFVAPYKGRFFFSLLSMVVVSLCVVAFISLVIPIFDDVLTPSSAVEMRGEQTYPQKENVLSLLNRYLHIDRMFKITRQTIFYQVPIIVIFIFLVKGVFSYGANYFMSFVGQSVVMDLRNQLYQKIQYQSLNFFSEHPTGLLMSRVISDMERMQEAVSEKLGDLLRGSLTLLGLVAYIFYLDWRLATISIFVAPLVIYPIIKLGYKLRATSYSSQERMAELSTQLFETITGNRIVKAFGMEKFEIKKFIKATRRLLRVNLRAVRFVSLTPPLMEIIGAIAAALMIWYGGRQISRGLMSTGIFCTFLAAIYGMYEPIKKLSRVSNAFQQAIAASQRAFQVLDIVSEIREDSHPIELTPPIKEIEFREVSFQYKDELVLNKVSFRVDPGEVLAIAGASGAGKSTLVNLIPRFYDVTSGAIFINGTDIRRYSLRSLRAQIGVVTQETILFNDTFRNNIAYGNIKTTPEEVEAVARAAFAHEFIEKLSQGYDTVIGEKGAKLSGGERQRIAIARALLKDSPILILDEATSALDSESEILVQKALANLMKDRTTMIIAHRLSTVRNAERIIVLDKGRIVEEGNHHSLHRLNGVYTRLYDLQFREEEQEIVEDIQ